MRLIYDPPANPLDPEAAALDLIVRIPTDMLDDCGPARSALQDFAGALHVEGALSGLSWWDARPVALAICADLQCGDPDAAAALLHLRAELIGSHRERWNDADGVRRALSIAARVIAL